MKKNRLIVENFKFIFIGCVDFSAEMLNKMILIGYKPNLVITKSESNFNSDFNDLTKICNKYSIESIYSDDINSKSIFKKIYSIDPEVIFCLGWSSLIKKELLNLPKIGVIGYHPSLLPLNRGRHPIIWSLSLGLEITGSTFFLMDEGADSGDIISQEKVKIDINDNASSLYNKLIVTAKKQLETIIPKLIDKSFIKTKQNEIKANYWRKRTKYDGFLDFRMSSLTIYNIVRSLNKPYPGAYFLYNGNEFKLWKVKIQSSNLKNIEPGKILEINGREILVKTADSSIWLIDHNLIDIPKLNTYLL